MRSGALDRVITFQRAADTLDEFRAPVTMWADLATMRAKLVSNDDQDREQAVGAVSQAWLTFQTRWLDGLTLADQLVYQGEGYRLKGLTEIGRRRGLLVKAERIGP